MRKAILDFDSNNRCNVWIGYNRFQFSGHHTLQFCLGDWVDTELQYDSDYSLWYATFSKGTIFFLHPKRYYHVRVFEHLIVPIPLTDDDEGLGQLYEPPFLPLF